MRELRLCAPSVGVRIRADFSLPKSSEEFLRALEQLITPGEPRAIIDIELRRDPNGSRAQAIRQHFGSPAQGVLGTLPPSERARMLVSPDEGTLALDWHKEAGVLLAERRSGRCEIFGMPARASLGWMINYVVATIFARAAACVVVHGSAVRLGQRNILICGPTGSGKTSLGLLLFSHGGWLLTEDVSYLDQNLRCAPRPIRDFVHVRAGMLAALPWLRDRLPPDSLGAISLDGSREELLAIGRKGQVEAPLAQFLDPRLGHAPQPIDLIVMPQVGGHGSAVIVKELNWAETHDKLLVSSIPESTIRWVEELAAPGTFARWQSRHPFNSTKRAISVLLPLDFPESASRLIDVLSRD